MPANAKVTNEEVVAAYKEYGSVWKSAKKLGVCGQSVWERLRRMGHVLPGSKWTEEESAILRKHAGTVSISELASIIGRPYGTVASKLSELGISGRAKPVPVKLRGTGLTQATTKQLAKQLGEFSGVITHFAKQNGFKVDVLVKALQRYTPEFWKLYSESRSDLPSAKCEYCEEEFFRLNKKQKTCTRNCQARLRSDRQYFNNNRRNTVGLAEGVCQVCLATNKRLSSHHAWGKENDEEATFLVAVCSGCHDLIGRLASSKKYVDAGFYERLIIFTSLRRNGQQKPIGFHAHVELEELSEEEMECEFW